MHWVISRITGAHNSPLHLNGTCDSSFMNSGHYHGKHVHKGGGGGCRTCMSEGVSLTLLSLCLATLVKHFKRSRYEGKVLLLLQRGSISLGRFPHCSGRLLIHQEWFVKTGTGGTATWREEARKPGQMLQSHNQEILSLQLTKTQRQLIAFKDTNWSRNTTP